MGALFDEYIKGVQAKGGTPSPKPSMVQTGQEYTGSFGQKVMSFLGGAGRSANETLTSAVDRGVQWFNSVNPEGAKDIPRPTMPDRTLPKPVTGNKFVDETITPIAGEIILALGAEALTLGFAPAAEALALRGAAALATRVPKISSMVQRTYSAISATKTGAAAAKIAASPVGRAFVREGIVGAETGALVAYGQGKEMDDVVERAFHYGLWGAGLGAGFSYVIPKIGGAIGRATGRAAADTAQTGLGRSVGAVTRESDSLMMTGRTITNFADATDDATRRAVGDATQWKGYADSLVRNMDNAEAEQAVRKIIDDWIPNRTPAGTVIDPEMHVAVSYLDDLMKRATASADTAVSSKLRDEASDLAMDIFKKAEDNPMLKERFIQVFGKLDNDTMEVTAKKLITQNGGDLSKHWTPEIKDKVMSRLDDIKSMDYGYKRALATGQMLNTVVEGMGVGLAKKIKGFRTYSMLSGISTTVNNIAGSASNDIMERVSKIPSVLIDNMYSALTGKARTVGFGSTGQGVAGFSEGAYKGFKEVWAGVRLTADGYIDVQSNTFKSVVGGFVEKLVQQGLYIPDKAFYVSKYSRVADELMKLKGTKYIDDAIHETAHFEALRTTLNSQNKMATALDYMRKKMNKLSTLGSTEDFGAGDILMPFIKVPLNLARTGFVDFTPLGLYKVLGEMVKPIVGKTANRREIMLQLGKVATGTSMMGAGYFLAKTGIMTGGAAKWDSTLDPLLNQQGMGKNRINFSALKRFLLTGGDPASTEKQEGDSIVSYDWIQPAAIPFSIGASVAEAQAKDVDNALGMAGMVQAAGTGALGVFNEETFVGNLMHNFITLFNATSEEGQQDAMFKLQRIVTGVPASFIPNLLNGVRKMADNNRRKTFDENWSTHAINLMKNKIPGLSKSLEIKYTPFGEVEKYFPPESNAVLNALINPWAINHYDLSPEEQFLADVYGRVVEQYPVKYPTKKEKEQQEIIAAIYNAAGKKAPAQDRPEAWDILPYQFGKIRNPDGKSEAIELTEQQQIELQKDTSYRIIANINALWGTGDYGKADDTKKLALIKAQVKAAGADAEKAMQVRVYGYAYGSGKDSKKKTKTYSSPRSYYVSRKYVK